MADRPLSEVVAVAEMVDDSGRSVERPTFKMPRGTSEAAADHLVCRMFTDAVFNEDIRTIQLIINRIDGGLPKDVDMDGYRTKFSDCFDEIMAMTDGEQLRLSPDDTVMMALCKALFALATQDIYWDHRTGKPRRPSTDKKQERDAALRMVLERTGGRKTLVATPHIVDEVESADWVRELSLPAS